jgi:hypothetical protein
MKLQKLVITAAACCTCGIVGCSESEEPSTPTSVRLEKGQPPSAADSPALPGSTFGSQGWAPDKPPVPAANVTPDHEHVMHVDWVDVDSVEAMTAAADVIVQGRIMLQRHDAFRAHARAEEKDGVTPTAGPDGRMPTSDIAITLVTLQVDKIVSMAPGMQSLGRTSVAVGGNVELLFPGGLMEDGCLVEPEDNPLPKVGEEGVFFLQRLEGGMNPVGMTSMTGVYATVGGYQGRLSVENQVIVPTPARSPRPDTIGVTQFYGQPALEVVAHVAGIQRALAPSRP